MTLHKGFLFLSIGLMFLLLSCGDDADGVGEEDTANVEQGTDRATDSSNNGQTDTDRYADTSTGSHGEQQGDTEIDSDTSTDTGNGNETEQIDTDSQT